MVFKLAETPEERRQAFKVVYDAYARRGLIDPHPSKMRVTPFSVLPTTSIVIACREGQVLGTVSLVEGGPLGFPLRDT